jgi:hypothetical protein
MLLGSHQRARAAVISGTPTINTVPIVAHVISFLIKKITRAIVTSSMTIAIARGKYFDSIPIPEMVKPGSIFMRKSIENNPCLIEPIPEKSAANKPTAMIILGATSRKFFDNRTLFPVRSFWTSLVC